MARNGKISSELTKEMLIDNYHISSVSEDGLHIINDKGHEYKLQLFTAKRKYSTNNKHYYCVALTNYKKDKVAMTNKKGYTWTQKPSDCVPVHRVIYAWHKGEIPEGMTIDHIDNNSLNNHIDNLQLVSLAENLQRKKISRNQYNWFLTDEEILSKRENDKYYYNRETHKDELKPEILEEQRERNKLIADYKIMNAQLADTLDDLIYKKKLAKECGCTEMFKQYQEQIKRIQNEIVYNRALIKNIKKIN